jgi:hypothetical protein
MNAGLVAQYAVIALLVAASLVYTLRKLAPKTATRAQAAVAAILLRPQRSAFAQRLGRIVQPKARLAIAATAAAPVARADRRPQQRHRTRNRSRFIRAASKPRQPRARDCHGHCATLRAASRRGVCRLRIAARLIE